MKRVFFICIVVILFFLCGCVKQIDSVILHPSTTATPTATPLVTPAPSQMPLPDDSLFIDFSGAYTIRMSYTLTYPEMEDWQTLKPGRPNLLCALQKGDSVIEVTLEEMPDLRTVQDYGDYINMMLGFDYEGVPAIVWEQKGEFLWGEIQLPNEGGTMIYALWSVDGLYASARIHIQGDTLAQEQFKTVFVPGITMTYDPSAMDGVDDEPVA